MNNGSIDILEYLRERFDESKERDEKIEFKLENLIKQTNKQEIELINNGKTTKILEAKIDKIEKEILPIKKHVDRFQFFLIAFLKVGGIGIFGYIIKLII